MTLLNGLQQILGGVIHSRDDFREAFGVGSPENNNLVKIMFSLEVSVRVSTIE